MKAKTVAVVERERESYVLENKTGLVFVLKFKMYYVKCRTFQVILERSFCALFSKDFTSGYIWSFLLSKYYRS